MDMLMSDPMISVVMPVYNGEKYLKEAIDSILNQTFTDFEFLIINDGSTDETEEIILSYDDSRIRYVKNETNLQIVKTLNKGIELARGKYIARMDADDISLPNRLEKQVQFLEDNPDIDICGTWVQTFGLREETWKYPQSHEEIKTALLFNSALVHPSVMIKKKFFDHFYYEEQYNTAEDYALWTKSIVTQKFSNISLSLLKYHLHETQTDRIMQTEIANNIRKEMLSKIGCSFSNYEMKIFTRIALYQFVSMEDSEHVFKKILTANSQSKFIEKKTLEAFLGMRFWSVVNNNPKQNMQYFYKFQASSFRKYLSISFSAYFKFFVKCLIGYSHAK